MLRGVNIGVIGAGNIGGTLASKLGRAGHDVTVGVRSPEGREVAAARCASVEDAVVGADALILALPGGSVEPFLAERGAGLDGVVVIDAANSIGGGGPAHHAAAFAEHAPGALMVRAFNTLGWENFADPTYDDERADMFWCGPAGQATEVAERIIGDVGLRPVRVGGPDAIDAVDGVLRLWFALMTERGGNRRLGFRALGV
jgi:8-hydroxy-5-deazaflavin:NADPH oxidoreductase